VTAVLGISAFYHDSAAALVVDGEIVAAAQEERFTRKKHDHDFPRHAVAYCLEEAGLRPEQLDYVGFYDKPLLKFERLLMTYLATAPAGFRSFARAMPVWLDQKLHLGKELNRGLGRGYRKRYVFAEHHESHAASAFFPSPFEEAAVLTLDGVGEWATASLGVGRGHRLTLEAELHFPHSVGMLYSAFTYFCGFKVNSGEYKLMGLAPYGEPVYADLIRKELLDLKADGSLKLDQRFFDYCAGDTMTSRRFEALFGGPPRRPEDPVTQREMDLAASIQAVTEDILLASAAEAHRRTGLPNLCLAGGVALNCVGNGRILREGPFERIWIQPAAGDAGGSLGVALFIWHHLLGNARTPAPGDSQHGSLLGPRYSRPEIEAFLSGAGARWTTIDDEGALCDEVAGLLADGKVVGWFSGRMEFGPRALGARSILADPRRPDMQSLLNLKIKFRESFRPFAPSVLDGDAPDWFGLRPGDESPYMLLTMPVAEAHRRPVAGDGAALGGLDKLRVVRSDVPAVTHVDWSSRVQTVDPVRHGRYHRLLTAFRDRTGCPVLVNTSFNVRGEPIVCTPADAWRCFLATDIDVLVLEDAVLHKADQPGAASFPAHEHLARFAPD
jgi:carbamoyltransferase